MQYTRHGAIPSSLEFWVIPRYQDPTDLYLLVAERADLGRLTILQRETILWRDLEITFAVLSESHSVTLRRNGRVVLHELLSCIGAGGGEPPLHCHGFGDGLPHSYAHNEYAIDVTVERFRGDGGTAPRANLRVDFPNPAGGSTTPFTSIHWEVGGEELRWGTIHRYALFGETVDVRSTSTFDPERALLASAAIPNASAQAIGGR
jgi:hypothetical protein